MHTRGPAVLAQTAATLAQLAPGRLLLGIGASVPAHVTDINGIPFDEPFKRTRDVLRFVTRRCAASTSRAGSTPSTSPATGCRTLRPNRSR